MSLHNVTSPVPPDAGPGPVSTSTGRAGNSVAARWFGLAALVLYALLLVLRSPRVLYPGRFWAEEGTVYFAYAWTHSWLDTLVAPHLGYYNLVANAAGLLAAYLPLEYAPVCTATVALLIQILPALLVLSVTIPGLETLPRKLAALLFLLVAPAGVEVYLNSITSHFVLSAAAGLVLVAGHGGRAGRAGKCLVLVLAGLTGAVSTFLTPLFWVQWWLERRQERLEQAVVLSACTLLQLMVIVGGPAQDQREVQLDASIMTATVYAKFVVSPLLLTHPSLAHLNAIQSGLTRHEPLPGRVWLPTAAAFATFVLLCWRGRSRTAWLLASAAIWMSVLSFMGSQKAGIQGFLPIHVTGMHRYYYAPQFFIFVALLVLAAPGAGVKRPVKAVIAVWLAAALVMGSVNFIRAPIDWQFYLSGPPWRPQVEAWRKDPARPLAVWPQGWPDMLLPGK